MNSTIDFLSADLGFLYFRFEKELTFKVISLSDGIMQVEAADCNLTELIYMAYSSLQQDKCFSGLKAIIVSCFGNLIIITKNSKLDFLLAEAQKVPKQYRY